MLCSNSLYHGDEAEIDYNQNQINEERENDTTDEAIEEWQLSRND